VDLFQESITFAITANLAYRRGFMPPDTIAILLNMGYQPVRCYSAKACRWLTWLEHQHHNIRHAKNGGEVTLGPYTVDGYEQESNSETSLNRPVLGPKNMASLDGWPVL
jgi:hypothetical protein